MSKVETLFLVTVNEDGTLTTYSEIPKELPEAERVANNYDVYEAAKQIVDEFDTNLIANKVAQTVLQALASQVPQGPSVSSAVKDKLKERGIDPESITATE
jgi:Pyruvate/2-oxoacid:ferredoxin oxidoreductase gamma subunit